LFDIFFFFITVNHFLFVRRLQINVFLYINLKFTQKNIIAQWTHTHTLQKNIGALKSTIYNNNIICISVGGTYSGNVLSHEYVSCCTRMSSLPKRVARGSMLCGVSDDTIKHKVDCRTPPNAISVHVCINHNHIPLYYYCCCCCCCVKYLSDDETKPETRISREALAGGWG